MEAFGSPRSSVQHVACIDDALVLHQVSHVAWVELNKLRPLSDQDSNIGTEQCLVNILGNCELRETLEGRPHSFRVKGNNLCPCFYETACNIECW